ncbi:MAG: L-seryl-tRNA(Sec) selenium transferase [Planctomycetes bacterium]|jgi:L-seryl-tRNA(Ser) seleniumtransferase|nr:L-seryl-tRNA(Sec) selenium transferase [Planctomycetota bacterium]
MTSSVQRELLRRLPSIGELLATDRAAEWRAAHPHSLVADCLRAAVDQLRRQILTDSAGRCGPQHVGADAVLDRAAAVLAERTQPRVREAINATGIILHTGLGRAVWPESVVDSMIDGLKGYVTLAADRETGARRDRDRTVEPLLCELTGAEAATVVNNNAAATMLVLAALAAERQVVVSRGELIEIGGAFRLPDVMAQSRARMVEVGTTNRTHLRDYASAVTDQTAVLFRAHPSNYRIVGFTGAVAAGDLANLAHERGLAFVDDLGAGALVDLEHFGLPHEPTMAQSIAAGADVVLASTDKLIGAGQGGVIVGRGELIAKIRAHPLARAFRIDKTCLMALERTLPLFRDIALLRRHHPTYRMLSTPLGVLHTRAEALADAIRNAAPHATVDLADDLGYLGSGSLPTEALPTATVRLRAAELKAEQLARALRHSEACVFTRIADEAVIMDVRTMTDPQVRRVARAVGRVLADART